MGMEQIVSFAGGKMPVWTAVSDLLNRSGFPVQVRMIDGQLAFPDEMPPEAWRELRLGTPQGMITVRRDPQRIILITWGNADAELLQAWNGLTWAFAEAGHGQVQGAAGPQCPADYRRSADLPAALRDKAS
jgi:hypothetical protein